MIAEIVQVLINVISGMFFGGIASLLGYAKGIAIPKWDFDKMLVTVIIGGITFGIIGGVGIDLIGISNVIANYMVANGTPINALEVYGLISTIIAVSANQIAQIITRRTDVKALFEKIKAFLLNINNPQPTLPEPMVTPEPEPQPEPVPVIVTDDENYTTPV